MRVLHVIMGISRAHGGPSRSAQGIVAGLNRAGVEAWLMTIRTGEQPWLEGVDHFINGGSFEDAVASVNPQIVHLQGIWSYPIHKCAVVCRKRNIPYIIAPRGMLEPWSLRHKWLKKKLARLLYQDRDLRLAAALHATAEGEGEQFKKLGFANPVIVSPNGVNVPAHFEVRRSNVEVDRQRRALFVSRMHPKKGVLELVVAWAKLSSFATGSTPLNNWVCELVYTLSGDLEREYEAKIKARVRELGIEKQFIFTGALNDDDKWKAYSRADLFVLPTYSENFGIVVAEALWAGVPVITTKGTPWYELEGYTDHKLQTIKAELKCGWWIDIGVEPLVKALSEAMMLPDANRYEMGMRGRRLVEEKYTWDAVVDRVVTAYEKILVEKRL